MTKHRPRKHTHTFRLSQRSLLMSCIVLYCTAEKHEIQDLTFGCNVIGHKHRDQLER